MQRIENDIPSVGLARREFLKKTATATVALAAGALIRTPVYGQNRPPSAIYFQGTDNKLWRVNPNGSGGINLGGYKTKSSPVVFGAYVYFQGTDDTLWRINLDGSGGTHLGGYKTSASPLVTAGFIYFRGTDGKLWRINLDGSGGTNLGGYRTKSTPRASGRYLFFQGTDDKLWRINLDGSGGINPGLNTTSSPPFVTSRYVYFRGTDDRLLRMNLDGTGGTQLSGYKTKSTPFVTDNSVYFQGTDDKLWRINLDGSGGTNLGGYKTKSSPVADTSANFIYAQGTDNKLWRLNLDGSHGTHLGGFDTASAPFVVLPANQPQTGTVLPRYMVLTLVYAPPGTNGGKSSSSVDYGSSSSTGATTSLSSSFQEDAAVTATFGGFLTGASSDFKASKTDTETSSLEVKKGQSNHIKLNGPGADGINHDKDIFYLWLNPQLNVSIDPEDNLNWQLGVQGPQMNIQYVLVEQLKNPALMSPGLSRALAAAGLTTADYAQILALNPFASGHSRLGSVTPLQPDETVIDPVRFLPTPFSFPYEPPDSASDQVPTQTYVQTNDVTYKVGQETKVAYSVGFTAEGGIGGVLGKLKVSSAFTWTNSFKTESQNVSSQSASVTIGGPALGYAGPTDVLVYWDTIYDSFMFAFVPDPPSASGVIMARSGTPAAHLQVTLGAGARTFSTFTNAKGEYRFYHVPPGQGKLSIRGEIFPVAVGAGSPKTTLHLTKS